MGLDSDYATGAEVIVICLSISQNQEVDHASLTGYSGLTSVRLQATVVQMKIREFVHKGLKRLYEENSTKGVPANSADKLRKMLAFLDGMGDAEELWGLPAWKAHRLTGDRKGTWSLSVTGNLRLTFRIDAAGLEIRDMNLEDYH